MSDVSFLVLAVLDRKLREGGGTIDDLLEGIGLCSEDLVRSRRGRVSWDVFAEAAARLGEVVGGPRGLERAGMEFVREPPGLLAALVSRYAKPHTMYYLGVRWFGPSLFRGVRGRVTYMPDGVIESLTMSPERAPSPEFYWLMAGALRAAPTLVGWPEPRVEMTFHRHEAAYRVYFASEGSERIDTVELERERARVDADIEELRALQAEEEPGASAGTLVAEQRLPLSQRVRWLLEGWDDAREPGARVVARRLGMSERTLARTLSGEGTSFTQLRDELRRRVAIERLARGERIEDVSARLGFADVSSFHRAFRRWTGRSPGSFIPQK